MRVIKTIILLILFVQSFVSQAYTQDFSKIDKVVIDAGHGGKDPGTVGKHSQEKKIALAIALKVGKLINENLSDVKVTYTRSTDVFVELYRRAEIANKAKADLFISIHCNSVTSPRAIGTETWIMGTHRSAKNLAVAKKENASILLEADYSKNYNNFDPNSPESYITLSLIQSAYREQSMGLAEAVQSQFKNRVNRVDRGVKEAGFLVLVYTTMPSILIETGFLSNPEEEKFLLSEAGQDYIASAIYRAFRDYKYTIEGEKVIEVPIKIEIPIDTNKVPEKVEVKIVGEAAVATSDTSKVNVYFGVQFATRTSKVNIENSFEGVSDIWQYEQKGLYKYVSGKHKSFKDADKQKKIIRAGKYKDAFVVAFVNGQRVSRAEAEAMLK